MLAKYIGKTNIFENGKTYRIATFISLNRIHVYDNTNINLCDTYSKVESFLSSWDIVENDTNVIK